MYCVPCLVETINFFKKCKMVSFFLTTFKNNNLGKKKKTKIFNECSYCLFFTPGVTAKSIMK